MLKLRTYFEKEKDSAKSRHGKALAERNALMFEWGIQTGGRVSEILKVETTKINREEQVPFATVWVKGKRLGRLRTTNGLLDRTDSYLYNYRRGQTMVFDISRFQADKIIKDACINGCSLEGRFFRMHILRHTFARRILRQGIPISMLSSMLNHKDPSVTAKEYSAFSEDDVNEAYASAMSKLTTQLH